MLKRETQYTLNTEVYAWFQGRPVVHGIWTQGGCKKVGATQRRTRHILYVLYVHNIFTRWNSPGRCSQLLQASGEAALDGDG